MTLVASRRRVLRPDPGELVSLAERMAALTMLRFGFCAATLLVAALAASSDEASLRAIATATVAYASVAGLAAATARLPRGAALVVVGTSLLVDGVYLAWVVQATGGFDSPLGVLVALHVLSVTLIASARTGLKVAVWHTLLAYAAVYGRRAQIPWFPGEAEATLPVLELGMLWAVGLVATGFSRVQERELRGQKGAPRTDVDDGRPPPAGGRTVGDAPPPPGDADRRLRFPSRGGVDATG